jgi:hypothetical protein
MKYYRLGRNSEHPLRGCNSFWEDIHFRPENWDLSSRRWELSNRTTELNAGRNHHPLAGGFNTIYLGEIFNIRWENAILRGKVLISGLKINFGMDSQKLDGGCCTHLTVSTSGRKIQIYLADPPKCLVGGLSSTLVKTIIFRLEDSIIPCWVKFSTTSRRTQFLLPKFQSFEGRSEIYITRIMEISTRKALLNAGRN